MDALERVTANPALAKSLQLANFLTFIVKETLAGRGDRLKAYTIATDGLGRDANFDPQSDPIVRVEAGRLRRALEQYYAGDGRDDPVIIELPLGHYAPTFHRRAAQRKPLSMASDLRTRVALATPFPRPVLLVLLMLLSGFVFLGIDNLFIDKRFIDRTANDAAARPKPGQANTARALVDLPTIHVDQISTLGTPKGAAISTARLRDHLIDALSRFEEIKVTEQFGQTAALESEPPIEERADYRVKAVIEYGNDDSVNLVVRVLDTTRNTIVWSPKYVGVTDNEANSLGEIVRNFADELADLNGVIQADQREKRATGSTFDSKYSCLLDGAEYWRKFNPLIQESVRKCFEDAIAATPGFALGYAYLARVYTREYFINADEWPGNSPTLDRALQLVHRAIELQPQSPRAYEVLSLVLASKREIAASIAAAKKALELNPSSSIIKADAGYWLVANGQVPEGMALLREAAAHRRLLPNFAGMGLALGAYLGGNATAALDYLNATAAGTAPIPMLMRIAATVELGQLAQARELAERLIAAYPGWASNPRRQVNKVFIAPEIATRIASDLAKAGFGGLE
jgi:tetratricopeptide (TPR) repeat protein